MGKTGKLKVRDYSSVHGQGTVNVTVADDKAHNLLSLNLTAEKAQELHAALAALIIKVPVSWADLQVTP